MSGTKVSKFELEQRRAEKLAVIHAAQKDCGQLKGLAQHLRQQLDQASAGLRESFPNEVGQVSSFLDQLQIPDAARLDVNQEKPQLDTVRNKAGGLVKQAVTLHQALTAAFGQKADQLGRQWTQRIGDTDRLLAEGSEILRLWTSATQIEAWERTLRVAREKLDGQRYAELAAVVDPLAGELESRIAWSQGQEEKHQTRRYVLNAINKVCEARGFQLVSGPFFEDGNDRGSRVIMTVDTMAKGQIEFSLALDGIHAESQITGSTCFEDFDALSRSLAEMYGVETEFTHPGEPRPELVELKDAGHGQKPQTIRRSGQR